MTADANTKAGISSRGRALLLAASLGIAVALMAIAMFGVSGRDDPYITFSAAEAIRNAGHLVNINGDPIEQSTSLLFTLILVAASLVVPIPIPILGWILGLLALAAIVPVAFVGLRGYLDQRRALAGAAVVGLTPPLVYWSASGAEQSLGVLLCLSSILVLSRAAHEPFRWRVVLSAAGLTALTFLTRPDLGLALLGATILLVIGVAVRRPRDRSSWTLVWIPATQASLLVAITFVRLAITGSPVPQPLTAKVGRGVIEQGQRGLHYVLENALSPWFLATLIVGLVLVWLGRGQAWTRLQALLLLTAVVIVTGAIASGGDWMELGRFFAAPAVLVSMLVISLLPAQRTALSTAILVALTALQVLTLLAWSARPGAFDSRASSLVSRWNLATSGSPGVPDDLSGFYNVWNADHLGDAYFLGAARPAVAELLAGHPDRTFTMTSGQGGMIPYDLVRQFGSRLRFIDRFQLMTDDFASCELSAGPYGSFISFSDWRRRVGSCAPELPDIVYSIGGIPYDDLGDDYQVVVHVEGSAERNGDSMPQEQWLAVRKELLASP